MSESSKKDELARRHWFWNNWFLLAFAGTKEAQQQKSYPQSPTDQQKYVALHT